MDRTPTCDAIVYVRDEHRQEVLETRIVHEQQFWTDKTVMAFLKKLQDDGGVWGPMNAAWYPYHQIVKVEFE
jgi:hypothetical protein